MLLIILYLFTNFILFKLFFKIVMLFLIFILYFFINCSSHIDIQNAYSAVVNYFLGESRLGANGCGVSSRLNGCTGAFGTG